MRIRGIKDGMTMGKKVLFRALIAPLVLFAVGCEENALNDIYRPAGTEIVFSAAGGYANGVETRTEYSGDAHSVTGYTSPFERIDWSDGDMITVSYTRGSNRSSADFRVGVPEANAEKSDASVTSDDKLYWAEGNGNHIFYAMYPAHNYRGNGSASLSNGNHVAGIIPAAQALTLKNGKYQPAMEYAYMVAREEIEESGTDRSVTLHFVPAITAFEFRFRLAQGEIPVTVTGFEMRSASSELAGSFAFDISGGSGSDRSLVWSNYSTIDAGSAVTVSFGSGVELGAGDFLDFTVLALPAQIGDVTVTFIYNDGTMKSLDLKHGGAFVTFDSCKKYVITNENVPGAETWTYVVEPIDDIVTYGHLQTSGLPFNVKSYKISSKGNVEPVKWKVQYSTSSSGPWSDTQPSSYSVNGAKFSINTVSGNGSLPSSAGESRNASILRDHLSSERETSGFDSEQAAIAVLQSRGFLPSAVSDAGDGYFDLSKHPIYGSIDGPEIAQETANCYVITAPGKYKFPLVYGNAIRGGTDNQKAYAPQGLGVHNDINYYLRRFVNHADQEIADPWLKNNGAAPDEAVVVWQDVTDASMQILLDSDISISGDYVRFEIKNERIRPGNILLAARKNGVIVWSWHIWVTEKDLTPHAVKDKMGLTHEMMTYNLGWTDRVDAYGEHWNDWPFQLRIVQTDDLGNALPISPSTGDDETFSVTQIGESISVDANVGSNCFYQWGRKDPILPAASSNTNKRVYSAQGYQITESNTKVVTVQDNAGTFGQSIQNPYKIFFSRGNYMYVGGAYYGNLWDVEQISHIGASGAGANALSVVNRLPVKSIYDPSPRGFVVPYAFAFTGFSNQVATTNNPSTPIGSLESDGFNFNDGLGGSIYLPYAGARGGDGVNPLYDVTATMYYWTAGKCPADRGSNTKSRNLTFLKPNDIRAIWEQYSEGAYAVRPVVQVAF